MTEVAITALRRDTHALRDHYDRLRSTVHQTLQTAADICQDARDLRMQTTHDRQARHPHRGHQGREPEPLVER